MLTTTISILAALALLIPGFIVVELSTARGARSSRSDLELALRALVYALVIHGVFFYWTAHLFGRVDNGSEWRDHVPELLAYVGVVLLGTPLALGAIINGQIARAEARDGHPGIWLAALGAGEARDGYDYAFQRLEKTGGYVIVELVGHTAESPKLVGGLYGTTSAVGQTPSAHDLYLQAMYTVEQLPNGLRELGAELDPPRGKWISASQIATLETIVPPLENDSPSEID